MKYNRFLTYCTSLLLLIFFSLLIFEEILPLSLEIKLAIIKIFGVTTWFILLCAFIAHTNLKTRTIAVLLGLGLFSVSLVEMSNSTQIWSALLPEASFITNPSLIIGKTVLALAIFVSIYFDKLLEGKYFPSEKTLQVFLGLLITFATVIALISSSFNPSKGRIVGSNFADLVPIILDFAFIMLFVSIGFEAFGDYRQSQVNHGFLEKKDIFLNQVNWGLLAINEDQKIITCNTYLKEKLALNCQAGQYLEQCLPDLSLQLKAKNQMECREIPLPTPSGPANFVLEVSPITTPSGEYGGQVAILKDLKDVRNAEMERISHRLIFDSTPAGLIVIDKEGRIYSANKASEILLDCPSPLIQGQHVTEVLNTTVGREILRLLTKALNFRQRATVEDYEAQTSGGPKILIMGAYPVLNIKQELIGAFCVLIDVTTEKTNERNLRRAEHLAAIGELSAAVAHEIRNPLTSIQGFLQLMDKKNSSDQQKEYIQIMLTELRRANDIIAEFLLFARPQKLNLKKQSISPIIEEVAKIMQGEFTLKNINFSLEAELIPEIEVDRDQLKQIFLNLFQNALQAMEPGGRLSVKVAYEESNCNVLITVQDTGKGIPEEYMEKIFTPFFTTKETGTGLGLSICNRIVQNHGGKMDVFSQVGHGANFIITLPALDYSA